MKFCPYDHEKYSFKIANFQSSYIIFNCNCSAIKTQLLRKTRKTRKILIRKRLVFHLL